MKCCVLEVDLEYSKELRELDNDHSLPPDKIEILYNYQSKTSDFYDIPTGNVKKPTSL